MDNTELQKFYQENLIAEAGELAEIKNEAGRSAKKSSIITLVILLVLSPAAGVMFRLPFLLILIGSAIIILVVALSVYYYKLKEQSLLFKNTVIPKILKFIAPDLTYSPQNCITFEEYEKSDIFNIKLDRYSGEDLISGRFNGVKIKLSELHTQYKVVHSNKNGSYTTWHDVFKGIFMIADFNKDFKSGTVVLPDNAEKIFGQVIGNLFQKMDFSRYGHLIRMEDVEFEKHFVVYGGNDIESRYILTPNLMEKMVKLKKQFNSPISFSFQKSAIYIAISSTHDFFEYNGNEFTFENFQNSISEISGLIDIVNELNLNLRIWSKL